MKTDGVLVVAVAVIVVVRSVRSGQVFFSLCRVNEWLSERARPLVKVERWEEWMTLTWVLVVLVVLMVTKTAPREGKRWMVSSECKRQEPAEHGSRQTLTAQEEKEAAEECTKAAAEPVVVLYLNQQ